MATINNLLSSGTTNSKAVTTLKQEMNDLKANRGNLSDKEYNDKMSELKSEFNDAKNSAANFGLAASHSDLSGLFASLGNYDGFQGISLNTSDIFFGAGATLGTLQAMNSARLSIQNRARVLMGEIGVDRMRGINTSGKEETLSNLVGSVDILDKHLDSGINKVLSETSPSDKETVSVIQKIKDSLSANEKNLKAELKDKFGDSYYEEKQP